jgi:hypothetical protein
MFLKYFHGGIAALLLFFSASCVNKCTVELYEPDVAKAGKTTKLMLKKANFFKEKIQGNCKNLGVFISHVSYKLYNHRFNILAARCALLGINQAYLECDMKKMGKSEYAESIRNLISALRRRKIKVLAVIKSPRLYASPGNIDDYLDKIISFNNGADSADEEFDGVLSDIRPDLMTGKSKKYTKGILYKWSPYSFGKGRDNDMLMKDTFRMLKYLKGNISHGMELAQALAPEYEENFKKGYLTSGGVNEFLKDCNFVALFAFSSDRRDILDVSLNTLKSAKKKDSVLICVKTAVSQYGGADKDESLSWKSWFKFVKDLEYVSENASSCASFGGFIFYDYNGLERMLE